MRELSTEMLYLVNGGAQSDYDFGYAVGSAVKNAWDWVSSACKGAWDWACGLFG